MARPRETHTGDDGDDDDVDNTAYSVDGRQQQRRQRCDVHGWTWTKRRDTSLACDGM